VYEKDDNYEVEDGAADEAEVEYVGRSMYSDVGVDRVDGGERMGRRMGRRREVIMTRVVLWRGGWERSMG